MIGYKKYSRVQALNKTLCLLLAIFIFTLLLPVTAHAMSLRENMKGSDFTTGTLASRLDTIIQSGISGCVTPSLPAVGGSYSKSTVYTTTYANESGSSSDYQCTAYARAAYSYLFGYNCASQSYRIDFSGAKAKNTFSYDQFRDWGVKCGAYLRTTSNSNGSFNASVGHSLIVLKYDSSGLFTLEGNYDGYGSVGILWYTWSEFNNEQLSGRSRYVCSFSQPKEEIYGGLGINENAESTFNNPSGVKISEGTYYIEAYCGKVIEVADSRTSNKANVQIWENVGIDCQKFNVTKSGNYYTLTNVNSGKVLDIADGSSKSGTNIWQYGANGTDAQKWQFEDAGGGYYYIRSALGTYMDVYDGGTANGTNVWAYKFNGTNAQMFKLISVSESVSSGEEDISADDIVSVAKSLVGQYPYVSGGESPEEGGFDCTGLVYYIYHTRLGMNMTLNQARSKSGLLALGTKITNKADLLPGDVLQMQYSTGPHVVIYIGNNQIVEAAKPGTYVRQQSFSNISSGFEYGIRFPQVKQSKTTSSQPYSLTIKYNANGGSITSNTYSATSSGMIQKGSSDVAAVWPYGYGHESGLYNASTFGLIREGYVFVGWSLSRDGTTTIYDQDDASIRAETIYPELRNGDATVTLYAIWEKQYGIIGEFIESVSVNVNGSTVTVHWMSYPYATSYYVRISDNTHVVYESGALPGTINEYSFTNIANGQYSASVELYTSGVAGIAAGISDYFIVHTQGIHFTRTTAYKQGQYTDVPVGQWFTSSVADAFELGLMKGNSATTFNPYGDVTLAEAITMASRIHSIYNTGTENFNQNSSGAWYQTYLDYAYNNGIINSSYYNTDVNVRATRARFAEILSNSLPDEALLAMNAVSDDAIPDVKMTDYYAQFVYRLYRAGILTGGDVNGTFSPLTYITRAEAATIISRMAESDNRIEFAL